MAQRKDIDWAIKVDGVSKTFKLPHEKQTSLKGMFLSSFKQKKYENQRAVDDVSFEVKKGEFFGIVGRNGSGKSTLLKMIAGVYQPSKGKIKINGSLVPFIELGVGFNPELSGRDNVFLNGALLGFSRKQMEAMYDEIVEFAELQDFMDQKLKNYSSGMQVRLAFSIAIRAESDILLLDEVLAVGDSAFQQKCLDYFSRLKKEKKTIILVTHNMKTVEEYCDRALLINSGKILDIGNPEEIATQYTSINMYSSNKELERYLRGEQSESASLVGVWAADEIGNKKTVFHPGEKISINCEIKANVELKDVSMEIKLHQRDLPAVLSANTNLSDKKTSLKKDGVVKAKWIFENNLGNGTYFLRVKLVSADKARVLARFNNAYSLEVKGWPSGGGLIQPDYDLEIVKE